MAAAGFGSVRPSDGSWGFCARALGLEAVGIWGLLRSKAFRGGNHDTYLPPALRTN